MRTEQEMCSDCGGFCCHSTFMGYPKSKRKDKEYAFLTMRSNNTWVEIDDGQRYFILYQPCPNLKNGKCIIYEDRPLICREYPTKNRTNIWETKCEVLRSRRKKWFNKSV